MERDEGGSLYRHDGYAPISMVKSWGLVLSDDGQAIQAPPHLLPPLSLLYLKVHLRLRLLERKEGNRQHRIVGYKDCGGILMT